MTRSAARPALILITLVAASFAPSLRAAPDPAQPELRDKGITLRGLTVAVRSAQRNYAEEDTLVFLVTFTNVSKADFTFLHSPKNYLDWKFRFHDAKRGSQWLATNTAKREGFDYRPAVLKAGEKLEVEVRIDSGFQFRREGPQDGKEGPRRNLAAGSYEMVIDLTCHGATKNVEIAQLPPQWVGEIKTKAVAFAIDPKDQAQKAARDEK